MAPQYFKISEGEFQLPPSAVNDDPATVQPSALTEQGFMQRRSWNSPQKSCTTISLTIYVKTWECGRMVVWSC